MSLPNNKPLSAEPSMSVFLRKQSRPPSNNDSFSISTSILDSTRPHIPRRLRPVSAEPVIRFPTEHIFQIEQCLEPYASQTVCKPKEIKSNMLHDIPSSVISRDGEYETNAISSDKLELEAPQTIGGVSDAVRLPIDIKSGKRLCFNETLVVSRMDSATSAVPSGRKLHPLLNVDQLVPVGGMALNIDVINHKFVINSATQFSFEGKHVALATIQAEYTNKLMVKYEKRCETLCSKEGNDQKYMETRINAKENAIEFYVRDSEYEHCSKKCGHLSLDEAKDFLLDGGCFLLMRYLVQEQFIGTFVALSALVTGETCRSIFHVSRKTNILVNQRLCTVYKVRRIVSCQSFEPDTSISVYLESGHLVRHTWINCPYVLHINPLQDVAGLLEQCPGENVLDARWHDDANLMARFVEMRKDRLADIRSFVHSEPNVTAVVRDYLYGLLLNKPANVLEFTVKHFTNINGEQCQYSVVRDE